MSRNDTSEKNATSPQPGSKQSTNNMQNTRRNINIPPKYTDHEVNQATPVINHQRFNDYQISDIVEELVKDASTEHKGTRRANDRSRGDFVDSSEESQNTNAPNSRRSFKKYLKPDGISNRRNAPPTNAKEEKEDHKTTTLSPINKDGDNKKDDSSKGDDENVTTDSLTRKSEEEEEEEEEQEEKGKDNTEDDTGERSASGNSRNHDDEGSSSRSDRWGMSVESPPEEFLRDVSRVTDVTHRKNKKRAGGSARAQDYLLGTRRGLSLPKNSKKEAPPKPSARSRSDKGSGGSLSTDEQLVEQLKKNIVSALLVDKSHPRGLYNFGYEKLDAWSNFPPDPVEDRQPYLRKLRLLMHALRSDDTDIPVKCYTRLPFRV